MAPKMEPGGSPGSSWDPPGPLPEEPGRPRARSRGSRGSSGLPREGPGTILACKIIQNGAKIMEILTEILIFIGVQVRWCAAVLVYWCSGVLVYWCTDVLVYWFTSVLVYWCTVVLVYWQTGVLVYWCTDIGVLVLRGGRRQEGVAPWIYYIYTHMQS